MAMSLPKEVILLDDSDDDDYRVGISVGLNTTTTSVARMPSPRTRARRATMEEDDDDDSVEVVELPTKINRKRPRTALKREEGGDNVEVVEVKRLPPTPLEQVQCVFPDVAIQHAKQLLRQHNNVASNVINALVEGGSYPTEPGKKKTSSVGFTVKMEGNNQCGYLNFMDPSSFEPSHDYKAQSVDQLVHEFACFTKTGVRFVLSRSNDHFAIAHDRIVRVLKAKENGEGKAHSTAAKANDDDDEEVRQYKRLKACMAKATVKAYQKEEFKKIFGSEKSSYFSTRPRPKPANNITDPILIEEIAFVRRKLKKWTEEVEQRILRKENREQSVKEGTALECACCFDNVAVEEMVQCRNEGHLFCQDCLASYVENQVFSNGNFGMKPGTKEPALELLCFHGEGCGSGFDRSMLVKALKEKVLQRYDELQTQVNLEKAGLRETVATCPKCGFTAEVPSTVTVFLCPNDACRFESCTKCREASHIPLRCDEVEKKAEEEGRTRVEEAASAAVIRFCPKCKKGIIKSDGCNKMTCGCGTQFCYLCRAIVRDYTHFCQVPHCDHSDPRKCKGKCPLWTKDLDAEHDKAMREAALAEKARVEAEAATAGSQEPKKMGLWGKADSQPVAKVNIDVDSILQAPKKRRTN